MPPPTRDAGGLCAFVLAGLLVGLAAPREVRREAIPCPAPTEVSAREGHTEAVECGATPSKDRGDGPTVRGPARLLFGLPLDLARVDEATLKALPGVGPVLASEIVRARDVRPFASASDLVRVPGIGAKRASRLVPWFEGGER